MIFKLCYCYLMPYCRSYFFLYYLDFNVANINSHLEINITFAITAFASIIKISNCQTHSSSVRFNYRRDLRKRGRVIR